MRFFVYFIIMGDKYTDFIVGLLENRIRDLRLRLDRSKYPICEDEKLTTAEVASIEAEIISIGYLSAASPHIRIENSQSFSSYKEVSLSTLTNSL